MNIFYKQCEQDVNKLDKNFCTGALLTFYLLSVVFVKLFVVTPV